MTKEEILEDIRDSYDRFKLTSKERGWIEEALTSPLWDWYEGCNGCNLVSEPVWPNKYFPPCLVHDFDWYLGRAGVRVGWRKFRKLDIRYRMPRIPHAIRIAGTFIGWYSWGLWKHLVTRKRKFFNGK